MERKWLKYTKPYKKYVPGDWHHLPLDEANRRILKGVAVACDSSGKVSGPKEVEKGEGVGVTDDAVVAPEPDSTETPEETVTPDEDAAPAPKKKRRGRPRKL